MEFLVFLGLSTQISTVVILVNVSTNSTEVFLFPCSFNSMCYYLISFFVGRDTGNGTQGLTFASKCYATELNLQLLFDFLIINICSGVRWELSAVLICMFLVATDVEHFSCIYWPFVVLRSVYLFQLPIFRLGLILGVQFFEFFTYSRHFCLRNSWHKFFLILYLSTYVGCLLTLRLLALLHRSF